MRHSTLIKWLDLASFILLVFVVSTGTLIRYTLPPRSGGISVWGLTRHEWGDIHFYLSIAFLLVLTGHLFTHAKWILLAVRGKVSREKNYRLAIGVISLLSLLALAFSPAMVGTSNSDTSRYYQYQSRH
jgi:uncharacterized membrane protein